jgi:hypothetical protein
MRIIADRGCGFLIGGLPALFAAGALQATEFPGAIPGGFSVSDQGAGQYTIPIAAPAATGGLKPNLALTYNHLAGDGLAGMRWTLAGFSSIAHCGRSFAQDVADDAISYCAANHFMQSGLKS